MSLGEGHSSVSVVGGEARGVDQGVPGCGAYGEVDGGEGHGGEEGEGGVSWLIKRVELFNSNSSHYDNIVANNNGNENIKKKVIKVMHTYGTYIAYCISTL